MKFISEKHSIKILIHEKGAILSLTTKKYSYLFFLSRRFTGVRRVITSDRIVAQADYDVWNTIELIEKKYGD